MTEEDYILIENYLKGLLSENEKESFLKRLDNDNEFNEQFKLEAQLFENLNDSDWSFVEKNTPKVKLYKALLEDDDIQTLKSTIAGVNSDFNNKPNRTNRTFFYYLAAASLLVFLAIQFFFNQNHSNKDLYYEYASLNELPSFVTRNTVDSLGIELVRAEKLFETKNYKAALAVFEPILESTKTDVNLYIYTGMAQTELGDNKNAELTFNRLINSELSNAQVGHWYKALLYLKQDKIKATKVLLHHIVSKSLYNHEKAKALLAQLEDE